MEWSTTRSQKAFLKLFFALVFPWYIYCSGRIFAGINFWLNFLFFIQIWKYLASDIKNKLSRKKATKISRNRASFNPRKFLLPFCTPPLFHLTQVTPQLSYCHQSVCRHHCPTFHCPEGHANSVSIYKHKQNNYM